MEESPELTLSGNVSPSRLTTRKRSKKLPGTVKNLLAIHKRIQMHLKGEKLLNKMEIRKLLFLLKRMDCATDEAEEIALSAEEILIKCFYSQESKQAEKRSLTPDSRGLSLVPSKSAEKQTSFNSTEDSDIQKPNIYISQPFDNNTDSIPYFPIQQFQPQQQLCDDQTRSPNLFSSQSIDKDINVGEILSNPDNRDANSDSLLSYKSEVSRQEPNVLNDSNSEECRKLSPFTVPTLLETKDFFNISQKSKVLKLKLCDVQIDDDTVSIPIELLTNLNFRNSDEEVQDLPCSHNQNADNNSYNPFSIKSTHTNTQNKVPFSSSSSFTKQNGFNIPPVENPFLNSSENITEWISCPRTTESKNSLNISSFSTNVESPLASVNMNTIWNQEMSSSENQLIFNNQDCCTQVTMSPSHALPCVQNNQDALHTSFATVPENINADKLDFTDSRYMDYGTSMRNTEIENAKTDKENAMEICRSFMDGEVTEVEKRYLDMAATDTTSIETNDLISFDNVYNTNKLSQSIVEEDGEGSFVFDLGTNNSSVDFIEGIPLDDLIGKRCGNGIKVHIYKDPKPKNPPPYPNTITENQNIIIDETPSISETSDMIIDETPSVCESKNVFTENVVSTSHFSNGNPWVQTTALEKPSMDAPYHETTQSKSLLDLYTNQNMTQSNSFLDLYNSNNYNSCSLEKPFVIGGAKISDDTKSYSKPIMETQSLSLLELMTQVHRPPQDNILSCIEKLDIVLTDKSPQYNFTLITDSKPIPSQSENIITIEGEILHATDYSSDNKQTTLVDSGVETSEGKATIQSTPEINSWRKLWNKRPITEKVCLKYVKEFGLNIYEDPVTSLLNLDYKEKVDDYHFPRLSLDQINGRLTKSCEKVDVLNEALTKMIDDQISSKSKKSYLFSTARDVSSDSDSDSSEDEQTKLEKRLMAAMRLEMREFMKDIEKKLLDRQKKNHLLQCDGKKRSKIVLRRKKWK